MWDSNFDAVDISSYITGYPNTAILFLLGGTSITAADPDAANAFNYSWPDNGAGNTHNFMSDLQIYTTDDVAGLPSDTFTANTGKVSLLTNHRGRPLTAEQWA